MISHIQHFGDARGHLLDLRCHPLFQGHVRHTTSLASPFEPDVGRIVLNIDQGYMPTVGGHSRVDLFFQKLLDGLALRRFQARLGQCIAVILDRLDFRHVVAKHVLDTVHEAGRGPLEFQVGHSIFEAAVGDGATALGRRWLDAGVDQVFDLRPDGVFATRFRSVRRRGGSRDHGFSR